MSKYLHIAPVRSQELACLGRGLIGSARFFVTEQSQLSVNLGNDKQNRNQKYRKTQISHPRLDRIGPGYYILDSQLDVARHTHQLGLFPDVAGVLSHH